MTTADAIIRLRELVGENRTAMLTTQTPNGSLHSRPAHVAEISDDGSAAFLVDAGADWVLGLRAGDQVNVALSDENDRCWVSIAGTARIDEDRATIHRLWSDAFARYFPDGPDSSSIRVLTIRSTVADYWDVPSGPIGRLAVKASSLMGNKEAPQGESGSIDLH